MSRPAPTTKRRRLRVFTVGHSTRSTDELVELLRAWDVRSLIDIRGIPRSRTNPQFNADALPRTLEAAGIGWMHLPELGGRRKKSATVEPSTNAGWNVAAFHNYADYALSAPFRAGLQTLLARARREPCAVMCAEAVWWRCHRRIVADHLLARGVEVVHLFSATKGEPASLTPFAVVGPGPRVTYPAASGADEA